MLNWLSPKKPPHEHELFKLLQFGKADAALKLLNDETIDVKVVQAGHPRNGYTALHWTCQSTLVSRFPEKWTRLFHRLLQCGAHREKKDNEGKIATYYLTEWQRGRLDIELARYDDEVKAAAVGKKRTTGSSSFLFRMGFRMGKAAYCNLVETIEGKAFRYMEERRYEDLLRIVEQREKNSIDFDKTDKNGNTLLHLAAKHSQAEVVRKLIYHGANTKALNHAGEQPGDCIDSLLVSRVASDLRALLPASEKRLDDFVMLTPVQLTPAKKSVSLPAVKREDPNMPKAKPKIRAGSVPTERKEPPAKSSKEDKTSFYNIMKQLERQHPVESDRATCEPESSEKSAMSDDEFHELLKEGAGMKTDESSQKDKLWFYNLMKKLERKFPVESDRATCEPKGSEKSAMRDAQLYELLKKDAGMKTVELKIPSSWKASGSFRPAPPEGKPKIEETKTKSLEKAA